MPPRLPLRLRNALAELILDALDVDADARATRDTACIAIALLVTYDRLATATAPIVDLGRLRVAAARGPTGLGPTRLGPTRLGPTRLGPTRLGTADDRGLDRLLDTLMTDASGPGGERGICLRPDFLPWLQTVGDHTTRYRAVLDAAATLPVCQAPGLSGVVARGAILFNAGLFYEVHEVLERAWRTAAGDQKTFLQGLVQIAVALYHHGQGNHRGARSLLHAGHDKLDATRAAAPPVIDLAALLAALTSWRAFLDSSTGESPPTTPAPPLPRCPILPSERAWHPVSE